MRSTGFVLACLALAGHGRRRDAPESRKAEPDTSRSTEHGARSGSLSALATLLQAGIPTAGWQFPFASSSSPTIASTNRLQPHQPGHNVMHPAAMRATRSSAVEMKFRPKGLHGIPRKKRITTRNGVKITRGLKRKKKPAHHFSQLRAKKVLARSKELKLRVPKALKPGPQQGAYEDQKSWDNLPYPVYAQMRLPPSGIRDPVMDHLYEWFLVGHITTDPTEDITPEDAAFVQKQLINDWVLHLEPLMGRGSARWDLGIADPLNEDVANVRILDQYLDPERIPEQGLVARRILGQKCGFKPIVCKNDGHWYYNKFEPTDDKLPPPRDDFSKVNPMQVGAEGKAFKIKTRGASDTSKVKR